MPVGREGRVVLAVSVQTPLHLDDAALARIAMARSSSVDLGERAGVPAQRLLQRSVEQVLQTGLISDCSPRQARVLLIPGALPMRHRAESALVGGRVMAGAGAILHDADDVCDFGGSACTAAGERSRWLERTLPAYVGIAPRSSLNRRTTQERAAA